MKKIYIIAAIMALLIPVAANAIVMYPVNANLQPGDVTSVIIKDGDIVNADINAAAAIVYSKLSLALSIVNGDIAAAAGIAWSKMAALTSAHILVGSAGNVATDVAVTGNVTISNSGVTTIGAGQVTDAMHTGQIANNHGGTGQDSSGWVQGEVPYMSATGTWNHLATDTSGKFLKTNGAGANPSWATVATNWKVGLLAVTGATGSTSTIAHGLGRTPQVVMLQFTNASASNINGHGAYDGSNQAQSTDFAGTARATTTNCISIGPTNAARADGVCTFDGTNITITWTDFGHTGTDNITWQAF